MKRPEGVIIDTFLWFHIIQHWERKKGVGNL